MSQSGDLGEQGEPRRVSSRNPPSLAEPGIFAEHISTDLSARKANGPLMRKKRL
jgi:hypothetical protein